MSHLPIREIEPARWIDDPRVFIVPVAMRTRWGKIAIKAIDRRLCRTHAIGFVEPATAIVIDDKLQAYGRNAESAAMQCALQSHPKSRIRSHCMHCVWAIELAWNEELNKRITQLHRGETQIIAQAIYPGHAVARQYEHSWWFEGPWMVSRQLESGPSIREDESAIVKAVMTAGRGHGKTEAFRKSIVDALRLFQSHVNSPHSLVHPDVWGVGIVALGLKSGVLQVPVPSIIWAKPRTSKCIGP